MGPAALAMQKCLVLRAVRADIEEGYLYFIHNKAGLDFSCDRPAALVCSFIYEQWFLTSLHVSR